MAVNTTCECRNSISVTKTRVTGKVHFRHPRLRLLSQLGGSQSVNVRDQSIKMRGSPIGLPLREESTVPNKKMSGKRILSSSSRLIQLVFFHEMLIGWRS